MAGAHPQHPEITVISNEVSNDEKTGQGSEEEKEEGGASALGDKAGTTLRRLQGARHFSSHSILAAGCGWPWCGVVVQVVDGKPIGASGLPLELSKDGRKCVPPGRGTGAVSRTSASWSGCRASPLTWTRYILSISSVHTWTPKLPTGSASLLSGG